VNPKSGGWVIERLTLGGDCPRLQSRGVAATAGQIAQLVERRTENP
jgi:hypothetical protein